MAKKNAGKKESSKTSQYDASVKRFLANKQILAWILKDCVEEFRDIDVKYIAKHCIEGKPDISTIAVDQDEDDDITVNNEISGINGQNTEDKSENEGTIFYDIRFSAVVPGTNKPVLLIINVEAQKNDSPGYPLLKRAVYYIGRLLSAQKHKVFEKSDYGKIQKVYSIWIQMNVSEKEKQNTITHYCLHEECVVGNAKYNKKHYDLINIVMVGLGEKDSVTDKTLLRLLNQTLSGNKNKHEIKAFLKEEFDISQREGLGKEINIMCNLGEGLVETTYASTQMETWADAIVNIMNALHYNEDEAMDMLHIPDDKREDLLEQVESRMEFA